MTRSTHSAPSPSRFRLRAEIDGEARIFVLGQATQMLGSSSEADLRLRVKGISRQHARLRPRPGVGVEVEDLGSKNGTRIAGRALPSPAEGESILRPGEVLEVGRLELRLEEVPADEVELALELALPEPGPAVPTHDGTPDAGATEVATSSGSPSPARPPAGLVWPEGHIRGRSPAMVELYRQVRAVLRGTVPVLIQGESGVGKEHVAQLLHRSSELAAGPFVAVNCAAIPDELLEAELFGIAAGVATGVKARRGKLQEARGGALLLDEVGDMPAELQAKLLRVLQERRIEPLGGPPIELQARVLSATHADLRRRVDEGTFRGDLFYRLAGFEMRVPALRERREDIPALVVSFAQRTALELGKYIPGITRSTLSYLVDHPWPGNVRQLEHEVRRLIYLCPDGQSVVSELLSETLRGVAPARSADRDPGANSKAEAGPGGRGEGGLVDRLEALERRLIVDQLLAQGGNQTRTARVLEISRNGLLQRMKRLGIPTATGRSEEPPEESSQEPAPPASESTTGGRVGPSSDPPAEMD